MLESNINIKILESRNFMSITVCGVGEGVYPLGRVYVRGYKVVNNKISKRGTIDIVEWTPAEKYLFFENLDSYNRWKWLPKAIRRFLDIPTEEPRIVPEIQSELIQEPKIEKKVPKTIKETKIEMVKREPALIKEMRLSVEATRLDYVEVDPSNNPFN